MADIKLDMTVLESLEFEIPCDYGDYAVPHPHGGARWVGFVRCPGCQNSGQRLICQDCKDFVLTTESGCYCAKCQERIVPFRHAFRRFEPLRK